MHLDHRHFGEAQHPVVVEIALLHPALVDPDLTPQRGGETVHDRALHLRFDDARVHDRPAVHRAHHAVHAHVTVRYRDLRYLGDVAVERLPYRDAARAALGQRRTPARLVRRQVEHAEVPRRLAEQVTAVLVGVFLGGVGQLVDEALDHECIERVVHGTPEADRDARVGEHVVDVHVGRRVRHLHGALDGLAVESVLHRVREDARHDGRRDDPLGPRRGLARGVEPGPHLVVARRTVLRVLDVVFARPDDLYRCLDGLGRLERLLHEIQLEAAPEAPAQVRRMDPYLVGCDTADLGAETLRPRLELRGGPDVHAVGSHVCRAVHRLHGRVRQERQLVRRVDLRRGRCQSRLRVAVVPRLRARLLGPLREHLGDARARHLRVGSLVPGHVQCIAALLGGPIPVGHDGDASRDLHDLPHARDGLCLGGVERPDFPAKHRGARDHRDQHPRRLDVDAELGAAVNLGRRVEPLDPCAEDLPFLWLLEGHVGRDGGRGDRGGFRDELPVGETPFARRVHDGAVLGPARGLVDPPRRGGSGEEQLPGRGTRLPQRGVGGADARAASGALHAEHRVDVRLVRGRELDPDLGPVGVELLGEQHGQRRGDALAHLRAVHHDEHALVGADPQPRVGREGGSRTGAEATASGEMKPDDQARAGRAGGLEEIPPRDLCRAAHVTLPARRGGWRRECAGTSRSGRCWSWPYRCPRRSDAGSSRAARRRP